MFHAENPGKVASLKEVIREQEFLPLLETQGQHFFLLANTLLASRPQDWGRNHLFRLTLETHQLETFLDDHGARQNRTFGFLGELLASLRWICQAAFAMAHIASRLDGYQQRPDLSVPFRRRLAGPLSFTRDATCRLLQAILEQAIQIGLRPPLEKLGGELFGGVRSERFLPDNLGEEGADDERSRSAQLAARFLAMKDLVLAAFPPFEEERGNDRGSYIRAWCREEQLRVSEVAAHNLQSFYDTYLKNSPAEGQTPELPRLRGCISLILHLFEAATSLIHLDERHENDLRCAQTRQAIAKLVDRPALLALVTDFCIRETLWLVEEGAETAQRLLARFGSEDHVELPLPPGVSLHARPAALIVTVVNHHGMPVEIEIHGQRANAASIMAVMILAGRNPGVRSVTFHGDQRALRDLELLFLAGLGAGGPSSLPEELAYLRRPSPPI